MTPEQQARAQIDQLLAAAGWVVQDRAAMDIFSLSHRLPTACPHARLAITIGPAHPLGNTTAVIALAPIPNCAVVFSAVGPSVCNLHTAK